MLAVKVEVPARLGIPEEAVKVSRQHLVSGLWHHSVAAHLRTSACSCC